MRKKDGKETRAMGEGRPLNILERELEWKKKRKYLKFYSLSCPLFDEDRCLLSKSTRRLQLDFYTQWCYIINYWLLREAKSVRQWCISNEVYVIHVQITSRQLFYFRSKLIVVIIILIVIDHKKNRFSKNFRISLMKNYVFFCVIVVSRNTYRNTTLSQVRLTNIIYILK